MCLSPIYIENPYHNRGSLVEHKGQKVKVRTKGNFDYLHDTLSQYIKVPCGRCSQCVSLRQGFYNQRIQMESLRSELFYFTLTYANRGLKYTDFDGIKIAYPEYKDIQNLFKRLRKILPHKIRMMVVSEYGTKKKRPHFHGYIAVSKDDIKTYYRGSYLYCEKVLFKEVLANWKRNISDSHKFPVYIDLCDFVVKGRKHTYELHWVQPIRDHDNDVSFYITKYILKYDDRINKMLYKAKMMAKQDAFSDDPKYSTEDYKKFVSQIKPRAVMSKDFGDYKLPAVSSHIISGLSKCSDYPTFFDVNTGKSMLLSPYYRKKFVDMDFKFSQYWKYLHEIQYLDVDLSDYVDSMNLDLLIDDSVHDLNVQSYSAFKQDSHFRKVKSLQNKR